MTDAEIEKAAEMKGYNLSLERWAFEEGAKWAREEAATVVDANCFGPPSDPFVEGILKRVAKQIRCEK